MESSIAREMMGIKSGIKRVGNGIGRAAKAVFRPNAFDSIAYSAPVIGLSAYLLSEGIDRIVDDGTLQHHATKAYAYHYLSFAAVAAVGCLAYRSLDRIVESLRQPKPPRTRWLHLNPTPPPQQAGWPSRIRSGALVAVGLAGLVAASRPFAHDSKAIAKHERYADSVDDYFKDRSEVCRTKSVDGAEYASFGCEEIKYQSGDPDKYRLVVPPVEADRLIISGFGERKDPVTGEEHALHTGIDILAENVYAMHRGIVVRIGGSNSSRQAGSKTYKVGGDICLDIRMDKPEGYAENEGGEDAGLDILTRYCCVEPAVQVGQSVEAGDYIARTKAPCTESTRFGKKVSRYVHVEMEYGEDGEYAPIDMFEETASPSQPQAGQPVPRPTPQMPQPAPQPAPVPLLPLQRKSTAIGPI